MKHLEGVLMRSKVRNPNVHRVEASNAKCITAGEALADRYSKMK